MRHWPPLDGDLVRCAAQPLLQVRVGEHVVAVGKIKERGTWDFALVSAAVAAVAKDGALADVSIIMGGVAPVPWRLKKAEDVLRGRPVTEELVRKAADAALADAAPLGENGYKTDLVFAALKRAVQAVV